VSAWNRNCFSNLVALKSLYTKLPSIVFLNRFTCLIMFLQLLKTLLDANTWNLLQHNPQSYLNILHCISICGDCHSNVLSYAERAKKYPLWDQAKYYGWGSTTVLCLASQCCRKTETWIYFQQKHSTFGCPYFGMLQTNCFSWHFLIPFFVVNKLVVH
jgi:hypothetical protein